MPFRGHKAYMNEINTYCKNLREALGVHKVEIFIPYIYSISQIIT